MTKVTSVNGITKAEVAEIQEKENVLTEENTDTSVKIDDIPKTSEDDMVDVDIVSEEVETVVEEIVEDTPVETIVEEDTSKKEESISDTKSSSKSDSSKSSKKDTTATKSKSSTSSTSSTSSSSSASSSSQNIQSNIINLDMQIQKDELEIQKKEQEIAQKEREIERIQEQLNDEDISEFTQSSLESRAKFLDNEISLLRSEISNLQQNVSSKQNLRNQYVAQLNNLALEEQANVASSASSASKTSASSKTNTSNSNVKPLNIADYNAKRGNALLKKAKQLYSNKVGTHHCAKGVSTTMQNTNSFGYYAHKDGCDYGEFLETKSDWKEVKVDFNDLKNLPAGAVVSWSNVSGNKWGHVYIADGNGGEYSDHYIANNASQNASFKRRGGTFRVFIPV